MATAAALPQLPEGPTLPPQSPTTKWDLDFIWNYSNIGLVNASKAPIAGETFGIKTEYLIYGGLALLVFGMMSRR